MRTAAFTADCLPHGMSRFQTWLRGQLSGSLITVLFLYMYIFVFAEGALPAAPASLTPASAASDVPAVAAAASSRCPAKQARALNTASVAATPTSTPAPAAATVGTATGPAAAGSEPDVEIEYCTGCKWNLRAAWMAQELLSTFCTAKDEEGRLLRSVALVPSKGRGGGVFCVRVGGVQIWDRKTDGGFPEAKVIVLRVATYARMCFDLCHVPAAARCLYLHLPGAPMRCLLIYSWHAHLGPHPCQ